MAAIYGERPHDCSVSLHPAQWALGKLEVVRSARVRSAEFVQQAQQQLVLEQVLPTRLYEATWKTPGNLPQTIEFISEMPGAEWYGLRYAVPTKKSRKNNTSTEVDEFYILTNAQKPLETYFAHRRVDPSTTSPLKARFTNEGRLTLITQENILGQRVYLDGPVLSSITQLPARLQPMLNWRIRTDWRCLQAALLNAPQGDTPPYIAALTPAPPVEKLHTGDVKQSFSVLCTSMPPQGEFKAPPTKQTRKFKERSSARYEDPDSEGMFWNDVPAPTITSTPSKTDSFQKLPTTRNSIEKPATYDEWKAVEDSIIQYATGHADGSQRYYRQHGVPIIGLRIEGQLVEPGKRKAYYLFLSTDGNGIWQYIDTIRDPRDPQEPMLRPVLDGQQLVGFGYGDTTTPSLTRLDNRFMIHRLFTMIQERLSSDISSQRFYATLNSPDRRHNAPVNTVRQWDGTDIRERIALPYILYSIKAGNLDTSSINLTDNTHHTWVQFRTPDNLSHYIIISKNGTTHHVISHNNSLVPVDYQASSTTNTPGWLFKDPNGMMLDETTQAFTVLPNSNDRNNPAQQEHAEQLTRVKSIVLARLRGQHQPQIFTNIPSEKPSHQRDDVLLSSTTDQFRILSVDGKDAYLHLFGTTLTYSFPISEKGVITYVWEKGEDPFSIRTAVATTLQRNTLQAIVQASVNDPILRQALPADVARESALTISRVLYDHLDRLAYAHSDIFPHKMPPYRMPESVLAQRMLAALPLPLPSTLRSHADLLHTNTICCRRDDGITSIWSHYPNPIPLANRAGRIGSAATPARSSSAFPTLADITFDILPPDSSGEFTEDGSSQNDRNVSAVHSIKKHPTRPRRRANLLRSKERIKPTIATLTSLEQDVAGTKAPFAAPVTVISGDINGLHGLRPDPLPLTTASYMQTLSSRDPRAPRTLGDLFRNKPTDPFQTPIPSSPPIIMNNHPQRRVTWEYVQQVVAEARQQKQGMPVSI